MQIHVIDFEGTRRHGISEFGVVTLSDDYEIQGTHFQAPSRPFDTYFDLFSDLRKTGIFSAHSAQTEDILLRHYWASPGYVPHFLSPQLIPTWGPWIDTKRLYQHYYQSPSFELRDLIHALNLQTTLDEYAKIYCDSEHRHYHHALYDALGAALLLQCHVRTVSHHALEDLVL